MNKKIFFIILLLLTSACAPSLNQISRQIEIVGYDFTKYSQKGFLITPGVYGENYESIGLLTFSIYPGAKKVKTLKNRQQYWEWEIEKIDPAEVIELAYQEAIKRNADAITHFHIKFDSKSYLDAVDIITITGIQVEGLLIKRK